MSDIDDKKIETSKENNNEVEHANQENDEDQNLNNERITINYKTNNENNDLIQEILTDDYETNKENEETKNNDINSNDHRSRENSISSEDSIHNNSPKNKIATNEENNINQNNININEQSNIDKKVEKDQINIIENTNQENKNEINLNPNKTNEDLKNQSENVINDSKNDVNDMYTQKLDPRNNNDKYLITLTEDNKETQNDEIENLKIDSEFDNNKHEEEDEVESFPFRILGDVKKKGNTLGMYHRRYLEIDSVKQVIKRYYSSEEYPQNPKEIIPIKDLKFLRKLKKSKEGHDFEITYRKKNKNKEIEVTQKYRLRNINCRNKWFDSILFLWKNVLKDLPPPKINKKLLLFIDDRIGIIQDVCPGGDKSKTKTGKVNLNNFKIISLLGVGGFGTVFKVKHIFTDKIYAMKVMNKNYIISKKYLHYVVSEFEIMKSLSGFPFVLDLHYCFQTANFLYLIIDICPGGDFRKLSYINNMKLFFAEVILAFEHIHNHDIIYRDLKPENILLDTEGHIKVCDFNLAKSGVGKNDRAFSFCGSPMYLSPELFAKKGVNYKCDIYGIGLLMYEIVTNTPAYVAPNIQLLYEKIKRNDINFKVSGIAGDVKDLLENMLTKNPDDRYTLEEVKKHPYFKDIDFDKVMRKEYGPIIIEKQKKRKTALNMTELDKEIMDNPNIKTKEQEEIYRFKKEQKKLDEDTKFTVLDGKVSLKEIKADQKRVMKNYVRGFYFVKKEDVEQTKDFVLKTGDNIDGNSLFNKEKNKNK